MIHIRACTVILILLVFALTGVMHTVGAATAEFMAPEVKQGHIDLRLWDTYDSDTIRLNGEWEWYDSRLLEPEELAEDIREMGDIDYIRVPSVWSENQVNGKTLSNHGYGTYRVTVQIPEPIQRKALGLYMPSVATAYKLWIDGKLTTGNGIVGTSLLGMSPKTYAKVAYFYPAGEQVELVLQVSNFVQRKGGLWQPLELGTAEQVTRKRNGSLFYEIFIIGCLFMMTVYHVALYLTRTRNRAVLYFALTSFFIGLRTLVLGETLAVYFIPSIPWEWAVKTEYIAAHGALLFLLLFTNYQYPQESSKWMLRLATVIIAAFVALELLTPARVYTELFFLFQYGFALPTVAYVVGVYIFSSIRRRPGSLTNLIGLTGLVITVVHDTLFYTQLTTTGDIIPLGFLFFLLSQSVQLSLSFSRAFQKVESLSKELLRFNESLEAKIEERTVDLRRANDELVRKEEFRRRLISNISHELMTPITSLKVNISAIMDRVLPADEPKHWRILADKVSLLEHLIIDLFELTKLEARQTRFHFRTKPLVPFVEELFRKYELDVRGQGIDIGLEISPEAVHAGADLTASLDPVRLEQVFINLLSNAKRHTPPGGSIRVIVEWIPDESLVQYATVRITDTGPGIREEEREHIFERYYRGKSLVKNKGTGLGLGLAISKEIIAYHAGSIGVDSKPGDGSSFFFTLPVQYKTAAQGEGTE
jgi:signal transduction histidine kinase